MVRSILQYQCCPNTLEFCQTSVWQNSRFCRTEQNFVGPNFFIKPIVILCWIVWCSFHSYKGKKDSVQSATSAYKNSEMTKNLIVVLNGHLSFASFQHFLSDIWSGTLTFFVGRSQKLSDCPTSPTNFDSTAVPIGATFTNPREDAGGLSREYVLRIPSMS